MASNEEVLKAEQKILKEEKLIESTLLSQAEILKEFDKTRKGFIRKIAKHRFLFTLIVSTAIILVWRGVWELSTEIPFISQSIVALLIGLGILWLIERYSDLH